MLKICTKTRKQNNIVKVTFTNPCNTEAVPQSPCASNAVPQIILCFKCIVINSDEFNSVSLQCVIILFIDLFFLNQDFVAACQLCSLCRNEGFYCAVDSTQPGLIIMLMLLQFDQNSSYQKISIFRFEVILKHTQVVCIRREVLFTISNNSFCFRDIQVFKISKLAK